MQEAVLIFLGAVPFVLVRRLAFHPKLDTFTSRLHIPTNAPNPRNGHSIFLNAVQAFIDSSRWLVVRLSSLQAACILIPPNKKSSQGEARSILRTFKDRTTRSHHLQSTFQCSECLSHTIQVPTQNRSAKKALFSGTSCTASNAFNTGRFHAYSANVINTNVIANKRTLREEVPPRSSGDRGDTKIESRRSASVDPNTIGRKVRMFAILRQLVLLRARDQGRER